ncbi:hypothetical protein E4U30_005257 [Claviceps sp. LM220 group G6]|nr:hypothetical protein E4U30_005257 [Claviceps sp. LM220 group G6]
MDHVRGLAPAKSGRSHRKSNKDLEVLKQYQDFIGKDQHAYNASTTDAWLTLFHLSKKPKKPKKLGETNPYPPETSLTPVHIRGKRQIFAGSGRAQPFETQKNNTNSAISTRHMLLTQLAHATNVASRIAREHFLVLEGSDPSFC